MLPLNIRESSKIVAKSKAEIILLPTVNKRMKKCTTSNLQHISNIDMSLCTAGRLLLLVYSRTQK